MFSYGNLLSRMKKSKYQKEYAVFRKHSGILRMSQALEHGVSRRALYSMRDEGIVEQLSRGVYRLAELPGLESPDLVAIATRIPRGVICLISALSFHDLTTHIPHTVDVAIPRKDRAPQIDYPPVQIYKFSGKAFTAGIEVHPSDGVEIRIYSPEKSIADAFKYRNKLGLDLALEALRNWQGKKNRSIEKLLEQARNCRVERIMRPYLEATL